METSTKTKNYLNKNIMAKKQSTSRKKKRAKKSFTKKTEQKVKEIAKTIKGKALEIHKAEFRTFLSNRGVEYEEFLKVIPDAIEQISQVYSDIISKQANPMGVERAEKAGLIKMQGLYEIYTTPGTENGADGVEGVDKEKEAPRGLGDTLEAIAKASGIKKAVDWFNQGADCGCEKRRDYLNTRFKYRVAKGLCMTETEYKAWEEFRVSLESTINRNDAIMISKLHSRLFNHAERFPCSSCPKTWQRWVSDINTVYKSYQIVDKSDFQIKREE